MTRETRVRILNSKGLSLAGILHIPAGNRKHPAVIHLHGFTGYKEEENNVALAQDLVKEGFIVLRFDASGDRESQGSMENDYRMTNYLKDIDAAYDFLCKHPQVDRNRIGVWGHSMGAMLAVIWASSHPEIKAVCAVSPPKLMGTTDWLGQFLPTWKKTGWFEKESTSGRGKKKIPWAFMKDAQKYNVLDFIGNFNNPILFVLGLVDDTVPPDHTREIYRKVNNPKELVEVEGMGHDYKKFPEQIRYVNSKIIPFFKKYLK